MVAFFFKITVDIIDSEILSRFHTNHSKQESILDPEIPQNNLDSRSSNNNNQVFF